MAPDVLSSHSDILSAHCQDGCIEGCARIDLGEDTDTDTDIPQHAVQCGWTTLIRRGVLSPYLHVYVYVCLHAYMHVCGLARMV
jgi:hypothetical protein